ncbi:MAG: hypothetical protein IJU87_08550 [Lachnospiraceae bacterium]|nr:hypothetical protein [Lachnospiraceae bacterium]
MKNEKIMISSRDIDLSNALKDIDEHIAALNLGKKDSLHLRLIAEEILGMMNAMTGDYKAMLWFERNVVEASVNLTARTGSMDIDTKEGLISVSSTGKNASTKGFMAKIGDIIENGILNFENVMKLEQQYGMGYVGYGAASEMSADFAMSWSLAQYRNTLSAAKNDNSDAEEAWDELEKSVVASIAKDVTVGVKKETVEMKAIMDIKGE